MAVKAITKDVQMRLTNPKVIIGGLVTTLIGVILINTAAKKFPKFRELVQGFNL